MVSTYRQVREPCSPTFGLCLQSGCFLSRRVGIQSVTGLACRAQVELCAAHVSVGARHAVSWSVAHKLVCDSLDLEIGGLHSILSLNICIDLRVRTFLTSSSIHASTFSLSAGALSRKALVKSSTSGRSLVQKSSTSGEVTQRQAAMAALQVWDHVIYFDLVAALSLPTVRTYA